MLPSLLLSPVALLALTSLHTSDACVAPAIKYNPSDPMSVNRLLQTSQRLEGTGAPTPEQIYRAANVQRVMRLFTQTDFDTLFPMANMGKGPAEGNGPYSYSNFLRAVAKWPAFCNDAGPNGVSEYALDNLCKKELAIMFSMWAQEVGGHNTWWAVPDWKQGLYYFNEMGCDTPAGGCGYRGGTCEPNTWQGERWPCPTGAEYFGRGAHQLSYNFNYGPFSEAMFDGDGSVLLNNPSLVVAADGNGWLAFASAIWFHMTPQSPKPSGHDAAVGWWVPSQADIAAGRVPGFGIQTLIINGGVECGGRVATIQSQNRARFYTEFAKYLGIEAGDNLLCTNMKEFGADSTAAVPSYWETSWNGDCTCQLVSYQTSWSIYDEPNNINGPYCKCVQKYFGTDPSANPKCQGK